MIAEKEGHDDRGEKLITWDRVVDRGRVDKTDMNPFVAVVRPNLKRYPETVIINEPGRVIEIGRRNVGRDVLFGKGFISESTAPP